MYRKQEMTIVRNRNAYEFYEEVDRLLKDGYEISSSGAYHAILVKTRYADKIRCMAGHRMLDTGDGLICEDLTHSLEYAYEELPWYTPLDERNRKEVTENVRQEEQREE